MEFLDPSVRFSDHVVENEVQVGYSMSLYLVLVDFSLSRNGQRQRLLSLVNRAEPAQTVTPSTSTLWRPTLSPRGSG